MEEYGCGRIDTDFSIEEQNAKRHFAAFSGCAFAENCAGGAPLRATELKLCYSDKFLYAYFSAEDADIAANYTRYNDPLYEEDVVELFISPTGERSVYLELEFNPNSAVFSGAVLNDCKGNFNLYLAPQSDIRCRSFRTEKGWECLVKMPFSVFITAADLPPQRGDRWLFNGYRIDYHAAGGCELYAVSPTRCSTFHTPGAFIPLIFD